MKVGTLKLILAFGSFLLVVIAIVTDVCLLSRYECFAGVRGINVDISPSFQRLLFQERFDLFENHENINIADFSSGLNQHIWDKNCLKTIESFSNFPIFPKAPDKRQVIHRTEITEQKHSTSDAHRMFGFIHPHFTGDHQLIVASNGYAELWLSESANWRTVKEIAYLKPFQKITTSATVVGRPFNISRKQVSSKIHLKANFRYYIEILYVLGIQSKREYFLRVSWKQPQESNFAVFESDSLFLFTNDSEAGKHKICMTMNYQMQNPASKKVLIKDTRTSI